MSFSLFTARGNVTASFDEGGDEIERYRVWFVVTLSLLFSFLVIACAPKASSRPEQDPMQKQIMQLQKQILELQKVQNDTRSKLDDVFATMATLSANIRALETKVHTVVDQEQTAGNKTRRTKKKKARRN